MALEKGRGWFKPDPPPGPPTAEDRYKEFTDNGGLLRIKYEGDGTYTFKRGRSAKGFPLKVMWMGRTGGGSAVVSSYGEPQYGGEVILVPWQMSQVGLFVSGHVWTEEQMFVFVLDILESGVALSEMVCGTGIGYAKSFGGQMVEPPRLRG